VSAGDSFDDFWFLQISGLHIIIITDLLADTP